MCRVNCTKYQLSGEGPLGIKLLCLNGVFITKPLQHSWVSSIPLEALEETRKSKNRFSSVLCTANVTCAVSHLPVFIFT